MSTPEMRSTFSETSTLRAWLNTWAAMAEVQADHGVIPKEAAVRIVEVSGLLMLSGAELAEETRSVGRATVPVLQRLRAAVGKDFANHVHVGSTTQDIMDTGLALQMKQGLDLLDRDTTALMQKLIELARSHKSTVMAGRTNGLQAAPITFGLKAAGWLAEITRGRDRLKLARSRALMVQLGGPVGTFDVIGAKGIEVRASMARVLGLGTQPVGWYTSRDGIAEMLFAIGLLASALGHMAVETGLLVRTEIDEVREVAAVQTVAEAARCRRSQTRVPRSMSRAYRVRFQSKAAGLYAILWQSNERSGGVWIAMAIGPRALLAGIGRVASRERADWWPRRHEGKMLANLISTAGPSCRRNLPRRWPRSSVHAGLRFYQTVGATSANTKQERRFRNLRSN